jgi:hypothetical protein
MGAASSGAAGVWRRLAAEWRYFYAVVLVATVLGFGAALAHTSVPAAVLGRYSVGYAGGLAVCAAAALLWLLSVPFNATLAAYVSRLPRALAAGLFGVGVLALPLIALVLPLQAQLVTLLLVNGMALCMFVWLSHTGLRLPERMGPAAALGLAGLLFAVLAIHAQTWRPYSPDEAIWAAIATNVTVDGGVYFRLGGQPYAPIQPGIPYINLVYAFLLEHVHYSVTTGRNLRLLLVLAGLGFTGLAAARLYGWRAGVISFVAALTGQSFLTALDYRPDHTLTFGLGLALYATARGWQSAGGWGARWHTLAGFVIVSSLNLHASAVGLAAGFSLYYLAAGALLFASGERRRALLWLAAFGAGALAASLLYIATNILPVGGFSAFLSALLAERYSSERYIRFLSFPPVEQTLLLLTLGVLVWRRSPGDRFVLGILACCCAAVIVLDPQGYIVGYRAMFYLGIGGALVHLTTCRPHTHRVLWPLVIVIVTGLSALHLQRGVLGDVLQRLRAGTAWVHPVTYFAETIRERYINPDDRVAGPVELLWAFQGEAERLLTEAAEVSYVRRGLVDAPVEAWEAFQPTVMININASDITEGLRAYMQARGFVLCDSAVIADRRVQAYRQDCDALPGGA